MTRHVLQRVSNDKTDESVTEGQKLEDLKWKNGPFTTFSFSLVKAQALKIQDPNTILSVFLPSAVWNSFCLSGSDSLRVRLGLSF